MLKMLRLRTTTMLLLFFVFCDSIMAQGNVYQQVNKINDVLNLINKHYVEQPNMQKLGESAIRGILETLDPHSVYITAEDMKGVNEDFSGSFEGIGVEFNVIEDTITIVAPITGGPSDAVGIQSGDKIVKINDVSAIGLSYADIPKKLKGPKGTKVNLTIKRVNNPELMNFEITRNSIPKYSCDAAFIIDGTDIGYLSINRFMATTYQEFVDSMEVLKNKGMKKIILDLRENLGGYLEHAYMIADEFIKYGHKIVYTKGRDEDMVENFMSHSGGRYEDMPLIILIDANSASASEILSGAIQDLDRGLIIGETSYGKGLVQNQFELFDGSAVRVTVAKYYTPSGRCIQRSYENKEDYRRLANRVDLKEGENLNHVLENLKKSSNPDSLPPMFKTRKGRNVLGGGGISPDYVVKYDTITNLTVQLRSRNLFFVFARQLMDKYGEEWTKKYKNDFSAFYNNFNISTEMFDDLKKLAETKKVQWNTDNFKADKDYLNTLIKGNIARFIWGNNEERAVLLPTTRHLKKAIELIPDSGKMAKSN